jgi:hypothetical protein
LYSDEFEGFAERLADALVKAHTPLSERLSLNGLPPGLAENLRRAFNLDDDDENEMTEPRKWSREDDPRAGAADGDWLWTWIGE